MWRLIDVLTTRLSPEILNCTTHPTFVRARNSLSMTDRKMAGNIFGRDTVKVRVFWHVNNRTIAYITRILHTRFGTHHLCRIICYVFAQQNWSRETAKQTFRRRAILCSGRVRHTTCGVGRGLRGTVGGTATCAAAAARGGDGSYVTVTWRTYVAVVRSTIHAIRG